MSAPAKILVIGQLWKGGTCESRRRALEELGYSTISFDTTPYVRYHNRFLSSVAHRLNFGPPVTQLNSDIVRFVAGHKPDVDCIWVDKGKWVAPDTLLELKRSTGATLIHYTPDPQLLFHRSHLFEASIPSYDVIFTTKPFEVERYRRLGAKAVHLVNQSYNSNVLYPRRLTPSQRETFGSDVCFVGHYESHYAKCLKAARQSRSVVRVWGGGWQRYARAHRWARDIFAGDGVWQDDYARALSAASIGLGLLSKWIPESTTTRTFEIPGCGTFLLAERTEHHLDLFREGMEAEFFGSRAEMIDKIRFYLGKPSLRKRIAHAGYQRCLTSGYSDLHRMRQLLDIVERARHRPDTAIRERSGEATEKTRETNAA